MYITGAIDEASRVWLESSVIKVDDDYSKTSQDNSADTDGAKHGIKQKDYLIMNYEQRSIDIDIIEAPPSHVVTGVRFRNLGGHLNLEVKVCI